MRYGILKIVFTAWVAIWIFLIGRELFIKDNMRDYRALVGMSLDGKRAYIAGEELYGFLKFCKANMPLGATYELVGVEDGSIDKRRAVYYLYPFMETKDPDFVLVFGSGAAEKDGYMIVAGANKSGYIMKKLRTP